TVEFTLTPDRTGWKWAAGGLSVACLGTGIALVAIGQPVEYGSNGAQGRHATDYAPLGYALLGVSAVGAGALGYWIYHDQHRLTVAAAPNAGGGWSLALMGRF